VTLLPLLNQTCKRMHSTDHPLLCLWHVHIHCFLRSTANWKSTAFFLATWHRCHHGSRCGSCRWRWLWLSQRSPAATWLCGATTWWPARVCCVLSCSRACCKRRWGGLRGPCARLTACTCSSSWDGGSSSRLGRTQWLAALVHWKGASLVQNWVWCKHTKQASTGWQLELNTSKDRAWCAALLGRHRTVMDSFICMEIIFAFVGMCYAFVHHKQQCSLSGPTDVMRVLFVSHLVVFWNKAWKTFTLMMNALGPHQIFPVLPLRSFYLLACQASAELPICLAGTNWFFHCALRTHGGCKSVRSSWHVPSRAASDVLPFSWYARRDSFFLRQFRDITWHGNGILWQLEFGMNHFKWWSKTVHWSFVDTSEGQFQTLSHSQSCRDSLLQMRNKILSKPYPYCVLQGVSWLMSQKINQLVEAT